jgi:exodeoxyribonuclease VII small subunit
MATEGFEDHLEALERIVEELESGELSLDDSMARFEEGVKRLKSCTSMLEAAEKQVNILVRGAEEPFSEEDA